MTRDYKPHARNRTRRSSGAGSSLMAGILIGLLLGLGIALAVALYLNKVPAPFAGSRQAKIEAPKTAPATKPEPAPARADDKPRFDFYNILPADDPPKGKATKEPARGEPATSNETFYLQAGAFQNAAEADNLRARLALLGIEASIQAAASAERGTLHRVRIGPFSRVEDVSRTRDTLKQNGIETTLIKGRDAAT